MGWLGWTEQEAMATDVNSINLAMEGKLEMMYPSLTKKNTNNISFADKFKAFARDHNAAMKAQKKAGGRQNGRRVR